MIKALKNRFGSAAATLLLSAMAVGCTGVAEAGMDAGRRPGQPEPLGTDAGPRSSRDSSPRSSGIPNSCGPIAPVLTGATVPGNVDLGLASDPEVERNPEGTESERECLRILNELRAAERLRPFLWDGDLADLARSHAADRRQRGYWHQYGSQTRDEYLGHERAEFLGLAQRGVYGSTAGLKFAQTFEFHPLHQASAERSIMRAVEADGNAIRVHIFGDASYVGCGEYDYQLGIVFGHRTSWSCSPHSGACDCDRDCCGELSCVEGTCR